MGDAPPVATVSKMLAEKCCVVEPDGRNILTKTLREADKYIADFIKQGFDFCPGNLEIFEKYFPDLHWKFIIPGHPEYILKKVTADMIEEFCGDTVVVDAFREEREAYNRRGEIANIRLNIANRVMEEFEKEANLNKENKKLAVSAIGARRYFEKVRLEMLRVNSDKPELPKFLEAVFKELAPELLEEEVQGEKYDKTLAYAYKYLVRYTPNFVETKFDYGNATEA